jgi:hypothetical protein
MTDWTAIAVIGGFVINAIVVASGYGGLKERVKSIEDLLKDGFQCKFHTELEKDLTEVKTKTNVIERIMHKENKM